MLRRALFQRWNKRNMANVDGVDVPAPASEAASTRSTKVLALSFGNGLGLVGGMLFAMVAARYLSKHEYATFRQTFLAYEIASPLLLLGLPNALYYFLPRANTDRRGVVIDNVALLFLFALCFSLFILFGGGAYLASRFDNADLPQTLPWMAAYALFMLPIAGISGVLASLNRVKTLALFTTMNSLAVALGSILAVVMIHGPIGPIFVRIIVAGIAMPIGLWVMFRAANGTLRLPKYCSMIAMMRYSAPLGLATIFGSITLQLHAFIVAALCSPEEFSIYINGAIEIPLISVVVGSITTVILAEMSENCAKGNKTDALKIFRNAGVKSSCILFPSMFYFFIAGEPFILFLFSEEYRESLLPFLIYLTVLPARIVIYGAAMMALGMTREVLVRSVFDLIVNAFLCYFFVRWLGYQGAALGMVVTLYLWTVPYNLIKIASGFAVPIHSLLDWPQLFKVLCISMAAAVPAGAIVLALSAHSAFLQLIASALVYAVVYGYLIFRTKMLMIPPHIEARLRRLLQFGTDGL